MGVLDADWVVGVQIHGDVFKRSIERDAQDGHLGFYQSLRPN